MLASCGSKAERVKPCMSMMRLEMRGIQRKGMRIHSGIHITAWDGRTIFNYTTKQLEPGPYGEYWYQEWKRQPTYWKFVEKDLFGIPTRVRQGKVKMYGNYYSSPIC